MKRRILCIMLVLMMTISCIGCGNQNTEDTNETNQDTEIVETVNEILDEVEETEASDTDTDSLAAEKEKIDLNLKEYEYSFEDRNVDTSGPYVIPFEEFKECGEVFYLTDSVNLYIDNGTCVGYTKPDVQITAIMEYEGWYWIDLKGKSRFVKAEDVKANGFAGTKDEYFVATAEKEEVSSANNTQSNTSTVKPETTTPETSVFVNNNSVENVPTETAAPVSDKYTPEEAVAVYRSIMEANGITWDPSIKEFASWGSGFMPLQKGQPEAMGYSSVESFAMGDSVGHAWTRYYVEITGSDEDYVYCTSWHCN